MAKLKTVIGCLGNQADIVVWAWDGKCTTCFIGNVTTPANTGSINFLDSYSEQLQIHNLENLC